LRVARLLDDTAFHATTLEKNLISLIKKAHFEPATLLPADLDPIRNLVADGAVDYTMVLGSFHYINRIADLLNVAPEFLPNALRRFEWVRRLYVRLFSLLMAKFDLENRPYPFSFDTALTDLAPAFERRFGRKISTEFDHLAKRPKVIETIRLQLDEMDEYSTLDRGVLKMIHQVVEASLPGKIQDTEGFHKIPEDPVEAFAFIGTRYAYRMNENRIGILRENGYDDLGILDLAIAVADANQWARVYRLLGLDPAICYI
jgi:hypothetical protein